MDGMVDITEGSPKGMSGIHRRAAGWFVLGIAVVIFATSQMFIVPMSHDELHFCHAAWLVQHGEKPFTDFLFHNTPGLLYLLRLYGLWDGNFGAEIMAFGRALCAISLVATAGMLILLGAGMRRWSVGVLAFTLALSLMVIPYNGETFRKQHWSLRPEIAAMPLALYALYATLKSATLKEERAPFWTGFRAAACASVAVFISPRLSFLCAGLLLVVLLHLRDMSRAAILGMVLGASIAPLLYMALVGVHDVRTWIIRYVAVLHDPTQGRFLWLRMHVGKFILVASSIEAISFLFRPPSRYVRDLSVVQLALMSSTFLEPTPSFASWQMSLVLGSLLVAYLIAIVWEWPGTTSKVMCAAMLAILWLYPGRLIANNVRLLGHPETMLFAQVDACNALGHAMGEEQGVFDPVYHPVVVRDASYYWTQFAALRRALSQARINAPPLQLVHECMQRPPAVLKRQALEATAASPDELDAIAQMLESQYAVSPSGYYIRADVVERLLPVMVPCYP